MDCLKKLKEEMALKRKQANSLAVEAGGKKFIRGADVAEKQRQDYMEKHRMNHPEKGEAGGGDKGGDSAKTEDKAVDRADNKKLSKAEVITRLRQRKQPICLFGESEGDTRRRLVKLELEQPDLNEGWNNEFANAMRDVDNDLVKDMIEGNNDRNKHDVELSTAILAEWESIESAARLFGATDDDPGKDCETILKFLKYLLARWAKNLNTRDEEEKKSSHGRHAASIHKQTMTNLRILMNQLESQTVNNDIRHHLTKICRLLIIDRDYIQANNAYMEMAIGNAPWPVGVTRSGLHQRPGSAKAYVSNVAHVLNDETQRKYIQAFKRLMTKCQEFFPTDPSKCVEFVRTD